jgi:uncharacterized membrane-anchored protein YhcB (DUF1043 family)
LCRRILKDMRSIAAVCAGMIAVLLVSLAGSGAPARRPRGKADAGSKPILLGTDPPGRLRTDPATDAGVARQDAGPDQLQLQLQALRARIDALERERVQSQEQAQLLQQLVNEVRDLRAQMAGSDERQRATEQERAARKAQLLSAVGGLQDAQYRLSTGDSSVEAALDQAASAFSGPARRDVEAARLALQNRDLSQARAYLAAAISDAAQER